MTSCIDFDWTTGGAGVDEIPNGLVTSADRGTAFRTKVPFACCDVAAGPIMVELRIRDAAGNVNSCMVEVEVQDKLSPFITPPPSVEVSCDFWFEASETNGFVPLDEDALTPVFGDVLDAFNYDESEREAIIIDDPGNDELPQPYNWGLDGWADDNCDVDITVRVRIFDDCTGDDLPGVPPSQNAVRLIERTFLARDAQGNSQTAVQRIWVIDFDPFYIADQTCNNDDPRDGVIWPCDEDLDFCPQNGIPVNPPTIFDDNCSLIGVDYDDQVFEFVDGACLKIVRTWTVIDWCQYNSQTGTGIWTYTQVIKVNDSEPTFILGCYDEVDPITRSVLDEGITLPANNQALIGEDNPLASSCSVHYTDTFGLSETCSGEVTYDVKVYPFNGTDFIQVHNERTAVIDSNGYGEAIIDTRTSDVLAVRLNGLPYNDRNCVNGEKDVHRVLITVEDGCGNVNTCSYLIRLEDRKQPTPVCVGLSSVLMPSSGEITIWAEDFNVSSFDDCTPAADLLYSFSGENYEPNQSFDCDLIEENGSNTFLIEIWVADEGNDMDCNGIITWDERNKDYCTTFIVIDDNDDVCPGAAPLGGDIMTEGASAVESVNVSLMTPGGEIMESYVTNDNGKYRFFNPLLDYIIEPKRNDDHDNGVSTLDLVRIQQHLLGLDPFESPYKMIAADANSSESVTAIDLVELRKLILGLYVELPNSTSWKFVDADFDFADVTNPWPYDDIIEVDATNSLHENFVAVKVGDVNGTVVANANEKPVDTRSNSALIFTVEDQRVEAGQTFTVPVKAESFEAVLGFQLTMGLEGLDLVEIDAGSIDMSSENAGMHKKAVTMSWFRPTATTANGHLFEFTFTATKAGMISEMISVNSAITKAEAYLEPGDGDIDIHNVRIDFTTGVETAGTEFALYQNAPNPFSQETVIGFDLPEAQSATITVYDIQGKVVEQLKGDFAKGYNEVELRTEQLNGRGVMYYRLDAGQFTATKKMVIIE